jgi:hypothetical protein
VRPAPQPVSPTPAPAPKPVQVRILILSSPIILRFSQLSLLPNLLNHNKPNHSFRKCFQK